MSFHICGSESGKPKCFHHFLSQNSGKMSAEWNDNLGALQRPAIKVARGMHGIGRVGRDLIETVARCLAADQFHHNLESPIMCFFGYPQTRAEKFESESCHW